MSILIGADIVPTKSNIDLFANGDALSLVGQELLHILNEADYRIFNLEVPLTDTEKPIPKCGPNLIAPYNTVNGLKALRIDLLTLANNHILDQGVQGLVSTCKALDEVGVAYVGVGNTPTEASKPYIFCVSGKRIGVYACAEHEFSIVSEAQPGANPYDSLASFDHVADLKAQCDYVIILYHGGKEHYRYPSPNLQKVCHKFIEKGANLIICQHTHCVGCEEKYLDGTIVYGQGNFIFDDQENEFWQTSLLVKIGPDYSVSYLPLIKKNNVVRLASKEEGETILKGFVERSSEITIHSTIVQKYNEFADNNINSYLACLKGRESFVYKVINKICMNTLRKAEIWKKYDIRQMITIWNYQVCEAHQELFACGIKRKWLSKK